MRKEIGMGVYPVLFEPIYKPKLWGGRRIFTQFERTALSSEPIGESWELADLEEDQSRVVNGPQRGRTITQLLADWGPDLLGRVGLFDGRFPLLIKFLDACDFLSVQVHPDERMARQLGGNVRVKHEAWYILAAEANGVIYHGLEPGVTAEVFREASLTGRVDGVLRKVIVRPGDCYYLPSGTPHALGAGVLVAEIQTPSDITYRTYDWGRLDPKTGQPRELHLEQAMQCIDFDSPSPPPMQESKPIQSIWTRAVRLLDCPCFVMDRVEARAGAEGGFAAGCPRVWIVLEGQGVIEGGNEQIEFGKGHVLLIPAALPDIRVRVHAAASWLEVTVPEQG
ncbi:MAG: mannose-6-phosphate isomerase [Phycisphaerales bacterium]|nr:mannose-6-phosphate isomerase [Phycisphaerales bacterium]